MTSNLLFLLCWHDLGCLLPHYSSCVDFAAGPCGSGQWTHARHPKPTQGSPGYLHDRRHGLDWPQHCCCPQPPPGCCGGNGGRQRSREHLWVLLERGGAWPGQRRRGCVSFARLPTTLCSCAHTGFFQAVMKTGQRHRFCSATVFYITLQHHIFPMGKTKW